MKVDPLPEVGDVLRCLIGDAGNVVLVDQHSGGALAVEGQFLHVDDGTVGDAADVVEEYAALALDVFGGLGLSAQEI